VPATIIIRSLRTPLRSAPQRQRLLFTVVVLYGTNKLFDVAMLPGVRHPAILGFRTDEIHQIIAIDERR